ncbi:MAG: DUF502 domain-containing protein [Flavobacteriales bacterium]|nr:DUF502 domain-containing protein [Flavobacteriales bacterium]MBK7556425.1 DUF502 domain-containing protein [Flavobacteriales bacterium]MBK9193705.1 DUF502 domain-containing protein [Flavobacteriales bacterium]
MAVRSLGRLALGFFLRGLLLVVPIAAIIWASVRALNLLDGLIPVGIPGLGILILLAGITIIGWLGSTFLYEPLAALGEEVLQRIPFLKSIFDALKDLMEALVGNKRKFDRPVLVRMIKGAEIEKLGFLTQSDLSLLGIPGNKVAVYLPHSFAWSGNLYIVPADNVTPIDAGAGDVMKFIVSGGVVNVDDDAEQPNR